MQCSLLLLIERWLGALALGAVYRRTCTRAPYAAKQLPSVMA